MFELPAREAKAANLDDRSIPLEQTVRHIPDLRARYGITRLADTTRLDRTGIPTFAAIVPRSPDFLSVYNGKGLTREAAMASAVMEAVERQAGAAPANKTFLRPLQELRHDIDLDAAGCQLDSGETLLECIEGFDLLSNRSVAVPLAMVQCPYFGTRLFAITSTNGLASGNTLLEAVYHALCELIERHTWSLFHAKSFLLPRLFGGENACDRARAPELRFPTGNRDLDALAARISEAQLQLRVFFLPNAPLPATMLAVVNEPGSSFPMSHMGLGCSLSPRHAALRAITEAVQSRAVDIQAAREDIFRAHEPTGKTDAHGKRQLTLPRGRWYYDLPAGQIELCAIPDELDDADLAADLRTVLHALRELKATQVIIVNLSQPGSGVHVVRAIVPDLETTAVDGRIGRHITRALNPFHVH